jgi:hypothetical protein
MRDKQKRRSEEFFVFVRLNVKYSFILLINPLLQTKEYLEDCEELCVCVCVCVFFLV